MEYKINIPAAEIETVYAGKEYELRILYGVVKLNEIKTL